MRNILFAIKSVQEEIAQDKDTDYMINVTCQINSHINVNPVNQQPFYSQNVNNLLGSQDLLNDSKHSYLG